LLSFQQFCDFLQNISGTQAAAWWQKLAADFPSVGKNDVTQDEAHSTGMPPDKK
jgi:hypothetical protein